MIKEGTLGHGKSSANGFVSQNIELNNEDQGQK